MRRFFTKKRSFVALAAVAVLAIAGGAFAYFTSTGSGTGTATVGSVSQSGAFTVTDTSTPVTLYPGTGSFAITGTINNPTKANLGLASDTVTITAPTVSSSAPIVAGHGCSASDFALTATSGSGWVVASNGDSATYTYSTNNELNNGQTANIPSGLSVSMVDQSYNQNNCEGATVNWTDAVTS